ncbi:hypothetical protein C8R47DRAFT_312423 [Mycena vitilis]|nr:hypothetical protein C8R47DRAFT_312423 [Mycena vitilis]
MDAPSRTSTIHHPCHYAISSKETQQGELKISVAVAVEARTISSLFCRGEPGKEQALTQSRDTDAPNRRTRMERRVKHEDEKTEGRTAGGPRQARSQTSPEGAKLEAERLRCARLAQYRWPVSPTDSAWTRWHSSAERRRRSGDVAVRRLRHSSALPLLAPCVGDVDSSSSGESSFLSSHLQAAQWIAQAMSWLILDDSRIQIFRNRRHFSFFFQSTLRGQCVEYSRPSR